MIPRSGEGRGAPSRPKPPLHAAVIDVGSNSVLLLTVAVAEGRLRTVDEALGITSLGAGLRAGGRLDPAARARTRGAVVTFARRARSAGASLAWAFATGAARAASDGADFARELESAAGIPVEILSGTREATLAHAAVARGLGVRGVLLVADIGGRTTELSIGQGERIDASVSLEVGALALTDTHLRGDPPTRLELESTAATVTTVLGASDLPARARVRDARVAACGGTATALAALDLGLDTYDATRVHGHALSYATLRALAARLAAMTVAERTALPALDPGRAAILPAGALVLERVTAAAGAGEVCVSDHGVRHAYLRERLAEAGLADDVRGLS